MIRTLDNERNQHPNLDESFCASNSASSLGGSSEDRESDHLTTDALVFQEPAPRHSCDFPANIASRLILEEKKEVKYIFAEKSVTSVSSVNKLFPEKVGEEVKEARHPQPGMNAEECHSEESKRPIRNSSEPKWLASSGSSHAKDQSIQKNNDGAFGGRFGNYSFQRNSSG